MIEQQPDIQNPYISPRTLREAESEENVDLLGHWGETIDENPEAEEFFERDGSIEPVKIERRSSRLGDFGYENDGAEVQSEENYRLQIAQEQREQLSKIIPSIADEIELKCKVKRTIVCK